MKRIGGLVALFIAAAAWADPALVDFDLALVYPDALGGMSYDRVEKYEQPAFGYSVFYRKQGGFMAEITVFNLGRNNIADGHLVDGIKLVFESAERTLERKEEQGVISAFRKRGSTVVPAKGAMRFANTVYQFSESRVVDGLTNSVQRMQSTYATATRGNFVKLDFTFDLVESSAARSMAEQLIAGIIQMLQAHPSEEELLLAACDALVCDPAGYGGLMAAQRVIAKAQSMEGLNVYTQFFVWPDGYQKPKNADLLVAAYFAGMLKVVIPQQLVEGGEYEGFLALLEAYDSMRRRGAIDAIPELDEWIKTGDRKTLFDQMMIDY